MKNLLVKVILFSLKKYPKAERFWGSTRLFRHQWEGCLIGDGYLHGICLGNTMASGWLQATNLDTEGWILESGLKIYPRAFIIREY